MPERRDRAIRFVLLLGGTASIAAAWWSLTGMGGILLAFAVAIVTAVSTRYYGVAIAHLVTLALTWEPALVTVALLEAGSFAYLATDLGADRRIRDGVALAVALVVFTGGVTAVARNVSTLWSAAVLIAVTGGLGYLLHRYGALQLDMLTEGNT